MPDPNVVTVDSTTATAAQSSPVQSTDPTSATTTTQTIQTTSTPRPKPGWKTSEFWKSLGVIVGATILLLTHHITPADWTAMTGGVAGIYTIARTWLKG